MEPLGVERRLTSILAARMVGNSCPMSADSAGMLSAIPNAIDMAYTGESIRSVVVLTEPRWPIWSND